MLSMLHRNPSAEIKRLTYISKRKGRVAIADKVVNGGREMSIGDKPIPLITKPVAVDDKKKQHTNTHRLYAVC